LRADSQKLMNDGNFKEAFAGFKKLTHNSQTDPTKVLEDFDNALNCMFRLGDLKDFDEFVETAAKEHKNNWRLLQKIAERYLSGQAYGFMVSGKFERGGHRGGGEPYHSTDRDRIRALQLMEQAMPLVEDEPDNQAAAQFYNSLANMMMSNRGYQEAWRLQYVSDTSTLPDYEPGYPGYRAYSGAPVDEKGNPIFYGVAPNWQTAASDGERWRWCLQQMVNRDPNLKNAMRNQIAAFARHQFGVPTMQYGMYRPFPKSDTSDKDESGTYALHTLTDKETIAKLASGIKRFDLPEEYNFIEIYKQIVAEPETGYAEDALTMLSQIHEDRRQYDQSVAYWQTNIKKFGVGGNSWKQQRIDQIVDNWGRFDQNQQQAAGKNAVLNFRFRNATGVKFKAQKIKVDLLLSDVKAHLKANPAQLDWNQLNIANIGYRLIHQGESKYIGEEVASWRSDLKPREHHFDRLVPIETPLKAAGAYLVSAEVEDGNTSRIVLWISDTTIVRMMLSNQLLFYTADAVTGKPLEGMDVSFFGYKQEQIEPNGNKWKIVTKEFKQKSNADGQVIVDNADDINRYQWMTVATNADGRLAHLGFQGFWFNTIYDSAYEQTKAITITDRPVYRPGNEMKFKLWVRKAQYDQEDSSQFAGHSFNVWIQNPKGDKIFEEQFTADRYGGVDATFTIPSDATLGQYAIYTGIGAAMGGNTFRVEEYKKPEFEVTIDAPDKPVQLGEKITAKITAKYYFGAPVSEATVKYTISRSDHDANWYPYAPWDWCYGPGYWWFCYDTPWYPGWEHWRGCKSPWPWWWGHSEAPPEIIAQVELPINADGTIDVDIDTAIAKEMRGDTDHRYTITAEVRDQSRRTIVGSGRVLVAREPFKVFTWLERGYYHVGDDIMAHFKAQTLDEKPVAGTGKLTLLKISYDDQLRPIEKPVGTWEVDTNVEGSARQQIKASASGQYRLSYTLKDQADHEIEGGYLFTIIGDGFESADYRFNDLELIPDKQDYQAGETVQLQINAARADATVLLFIRPSNGVYLPPKMIDMNGEKSVIEEIKISKKDMPNFFVEAMTVTDGQVHSQAKEIVVPPEKRILNVEVLPSNKEYLPGEAATVDVRLTDFFGKPFQGTSVVSIYDKSVEYISGGSNVPEIKEFFWKWRRSHYPSQINNLVQLYSQNLYDPNTIGMNDLGIFGYSVISDPVSGERKNQHAAKDGLAMESDATLAAAPMEQFQAAFGKSSMDEKAKKEGGKLDNDASGSDPANNAVEPTVRKNFADTAFWQATLETDVDGRAQVKLNMPESLTTWKINVWSMGHGTQVGYGSTEVLTKKNLLVRLQAPRFFLEKDQVTLSAIVHNYLKNDKQVAVKLEMDGDYLKSRDDQQVNVTVPSQGETRVDWVVDVLREGTATVRMLALTDEESDAMELNFPVHVHGMLKTESWAGTVRPEDDSQMISMTVPAERRPDQTRLEIRYSPTLAGAMVDALPYLADYPYGCTEQTLNRWLPTLVTQKVLLDMQVDLEAVRQKRTNLNAQELGDPQDRAAQWKRYDRNPIYDEQLVVKMVNDGVARLADMQLSDGGWGWFSGHGEHSSPHTTATVVHGLQIARAIDAPIPDQMLQRGIAWLRNYQDEQIQQIRNHPDRINPYKTSANNVDALVYMILTEEKLENEEMRGYLYRDRNNLSVYAKALFGIGLQFIGDEEKLVMILRNIDQFVVQDDENETAYLKLPEDNYWWNWYGSDTEADAYLLKLLSRARPKDKTTARLVKYLLNNRKHGNYWKSTRDTALCVEAFAEYIKATGEDQPDMFVEIWLDGEKQKEVQITQSNLLSFDDRLVLAGDALESGKHELQIVRRGKGPVYFNAFLTNFTLEDYITATGLEVKVNRKYFKLTPVEKTVKDAGTLGQVIDKRVEKFERHELQDLAELTSGDLVEVELTIESKNDYEYLLFEDMKPAGFEAVEVRSGYSDRGLRSYVEYRDDRVSFFIQHLARGTHSVNYRLRAEIPGRFSALPAKATGMYAPELVGNSNEIKLIIVDEGEKE
jgi:uncharacterized protein YfaS (alpha-2-macroglobulin family)